MFMRLVHSTPEQDGSKAIGHIIDLLHGTWGAEDKTIRGSHLYLRKRIQLRYWNFYREIGRFLVTITPLGFEEHFREVGIPVRDLPSFTPPSSSHNVGRITELRKDMALKRIHRISVANQISPTFGT
jgi:hypothetical protein